MSTRSVKPVVVFTSLVALAVFSRIAPHEPNLTALAAVAMFAGWYFRSRLVAIAAPLAAMLISDAVIGGYQPLVMAAVYGSMLMPALFGRWLQSFRFGRTPIVAPFFGAIGASILFFVVTNFAVWAASGYYPHTAEGLVACYAAAVPFFRYTLTGDLAFTTALFGGHALLTNFLLQPTLAPARSAAQ